MSSTIPQDDPKNYCFVVTKAHTLVLRHVPITTQVPVTLVVPHEVNETMQQFLLLRQSVFADCSINNPNKSMALRDHLISTTSKQSNSNNN